MKKMTFFLMLFTMSMINVHAQTPKEEAATNPLLKEWNTPYQTPPFDEIKTEHYLPAIQYAIQQAKTELKYLKQIKQTPNFKNTIEKLDNTGALLNRISGIFFNMLYCNATPELQQLAQQISPMVTEYSNDISLDPELFARVKFVYDNHGELTPEQMRLLEKTYRSFVDNGALLSPEDKEKYREISTNLSKLTLQFSENVLAATNAYYKNVTDVAQLAGLPESALAVAKDKAAKKGLEGYVFDLTAPSYLAILTHADNRELRKEMYAHYNSRAYNDEFDNQQVIKDILTNRQALAKLLGYDNYAQYALKDRMAENEKNVYELEEALLKYSFPVMKKELAQLSDFAKRNGLNDELQRWDFAYYSNKEKTALYDLNDEMLKPYFKLENVIDGVFALAKTLFELEFVPNDKVQVYHPDVKVYEVYRHNKFMAILYLDFHPRDTKKGGAWMTSFREQKKVVDGEVRPLVSLVMNFTPSTPDNPSLLTFDEVRTFLHEFGHATHAMLSDVTYESLSCTNVPRDFVELPSQLLENWSIEKEFLSKFAFHYQTQEVIPDSLVNKIRESDNYHAGYASCRQISFGLLDMMWHTSNPAEITDVLKQERAEMDKTELFPAVPNACMSTSFSHIFAGGYAAGYYGYKWAEVLDADAFSLFKEKGVFNKEVADSYIENILSKGGSAKAMELYVKFRGREPKVDALLERSGLK